ncbi:MAG: hypothetical protein GXP25_00370 [Planctomycetes bacterium]|nr:hypothetical protein [Planctomycetota bacterium]
MEQIRKHIFWIVLGVLLLALVVANFVVTGPVLSENERNTQSLESRITQLHKYAKNCVNKYHIEHEKKRQKHIKEEERRCRKELIQEAHRFGEIFNDDPALWKDEYTKRLTELRQKLESEQILYASPTPFHSRLPGWGTRVPTRPEMLVANKEYYILKDICDILCDVKDEQKRARVLKVNQVGFPGAPDFTEAEFDIEGSTQREQPRRKTIRDTYRPIATLVNVDMDSKFVEKLLAAILSSPWRYNIHSCDIIRKPKGGGRSQVDMGAAPGEGRQKQQQLPKARLDLFENTTVRVRLYLEALDFSPMKAALKKRAEEEATE